ncbi:arginine--tRNA ligase [Aliikangiella marina]|uniref:Arginine--tRNA ligase n=1 Tax=Aliikangiella marina TaxID=1712262 RepID=A0A545T9C6_9GAMM|nr:arginine--tRNA ligase [Aliikangiella marina]TQV73809.1 arginine--tRNA ligase [Aliikangiella marina]
MKAVVEAWLEQAINQLKSQGVIPDAFAAKANVTHTKEKAHGDFATNAALMLAKPAGKPPREVAQLIVDLLGERAEIDKMEIAGPGFINFFLSQAAATQIINQVIEQKGQFGHSNVGEGKSVQVEFVSANPTGPLHIGHGRGAVVGDCLSRLLDATGWQVSKEFYYNDAGQQINNLANSVQARCKGFGPDSDDWQDDWYQGDYIQDVANDYLAKKTVDAADKHVTAKGDADDLQAIREFAVAYLRREQDLDLKAFEVDFDVYFLESSLYENGDIEKTVDALVKAGHTYEKEGALWLKTTDYGDDKDRVMRKTDGGYTYFLPDVAYHVTKWNRGFGRVVNEFGADHHSTVDRVRAGLQALDIGIPKGWPEVVLHQMVTVMRGDKEVKLGKRQGGYLTLRDIIDEVGKDATRYFLAARRSNSQMTFDLELAASQTNENPVYYIQYAHARICSAFRKAAELGKPFDQALGLKHLDKLTLEEETGLMDKMSQFPDLVKVAAANLEPHVIAHYLRELAAELHGYYQIGQNDESARWIVADAEMSQARLTLIDAVRQVFVNGLELLGVSAPESM